MSKKEWSKQYWKTKVIEQFNSTPSTRKFNNITQSIKTLQREILKLERQQKLLESKMNKEQDKVANRLDKEIPNWRRILTS